MQLSRELASSAGIGLGLPGAMKDHGRVVVSALGEPREARLPRPGS